MPDLLPLFVTLAHRRVVVVGGGHVAAGKLGQLVATGADVRVVAPDICDEIQNAGVEVVPRSFEPSDVDGAWLVVAAATAEVNERVARAAEERCIFVNAVDDPANASAFLGGVVRRGGVTIAISTSGDAPALAGLLREAIDAILPRELRTWLVEARRRRRIWRRDRVPIGNRRPLLLDALNQLYANRRVRPGGPDARSG
jgi:uroporphyrin-III C-methyltransferase/precorrin-2 dehydrogenase/sirohydrochlorin ferrochelatase